MKNNTSALTAPLYVSVVFLLIGISKKLVKYVVTGASGDAVLYAAILELFVFAIPAAFFLKIKDKNFFDYSKVKGCSLSQLPFILTSSLTFIFGSVIILYLQRIFLSVGADSALITDVSEANISFGAVLLYYVIVPALSEELFFRSILISEYSSYGGPVAVTLSALFFAMLHFSFSQFFFYFFTGAVLGILTYVTNSAFPAIILHMLNNAVTVFFGDSLTGFLTESASSIILAFILVVLFLASLLSFLSSMEDIYEKRSIMYDNGYLPGKRRELLLGSAKAGIIEKKAKAAKQSNAFLSPTLFMAAAIFILITLNVI